MHKRTSEGGWLARPHHPTEQYLDQLLWQTFCTLKYDCTDNNHTQNVSDQSTVSYEILQPFGVRLTVVSQYKLGIT